MKRSELRICGYGGQGVILSAYVIGKAVAVQEGRHATLNQSFGPEARGSACSAQPGRGATSRAGPMPKSEWALAQTRASPQAAPTRLQDGTSADSSRSR